MNYTVVESVHGFNGAINVSFPAADRVPEHVPLYRKAFQVRLSNVSRTHQAH